MSQLQGHDNNMNNVLQTATGASYVTGFVAFFGGLSLNDWLAIFGGLMIVVTYLTNLYFRHLDELRKRELHSLMKQKLNVGVK